MLLLVQIAQSLRHQQAPIATSLHEQLILQLLLLRLSQLLQSVGNVLVHVRRQILEQAYDLTSLPITLSLGDIVVLLSHMHVPGGIGGIRLATVVEANELLVQLLGGPAVDLFALGLLRFHGFASVLAQVVDHIVQHLRNRFTTRLHLSAASVPLLI